MSSEDMHDGGQEGSILRSEIRKGNWFCHGRWFATYQEAEAYKATLADHHRPQYIIRSYSQTTAAENMTTKTVRRMRIRKKRDSVDQALIDKLVEQGIAKRGKELIKAERTKIREAAFKEGEKKGHTVGYNEGHTSGKREGKDITTREFQDRALRPQAMSAQFQTGMNTVAPRDRICIDDSQTYTITFKPELRYEYRVDTRLRVFELSIWKNYQGSETKKIAIVCNFTEEAMQQEEGAGALLNFLCIICVEGAKYMDAALLCEYMADWVTSARPRVDPDTPMIHVPKNARPTALAKFRDAIGLMNE